jgi:hypothetical protein
MRSVVRMPSSSSTVKIVRLIPASMPRSSCQSTAACRILRAGTVGRVVPAGRPLGRTPASGSLEDTGRILATADCGQVAVSLQSCARRSVTGSSSDREAFAAPGCDREAVGGTALDGEIVMTWTTAEQDRSYPRLDELVRTAAFVCPPAWASSLERDRAAWALCAAADHDEDLLAHGCAVARRRLCQGLLRRDVVRVLEEALVHAHHAARAHGTRGERSGRLVPDFEELRIHGARRAKAAVGRT